MTSLPTTEQIEKFVHSRTVVAAADTWDFTCELGCEVDTSVRRETGMTKQYRDVLAALERKAPLAEIRDLLRSLERSSTDINAGINQVDKG